MIPKKKFPCSGQYPTYSPMQIAKVIKSLTVKEVFSRHPQVKRKLWERAFLGHLDFMLR